MARILFLYDTKESDLAKDFRDYFAELDVPPVMIPLSADLGMTLEQKEKKYFDSAGGAIFLITPGSERDGFKFPSPSVSHELGQAKQKFRGKPHYVICLVDSECKLPAIEQITYIGFKRQEIRSIISALTQLLRDLKGAGFFRTAPAQVKSPSSSSIESILNSLADNHKNALLFLSRVPNGIMNESEFDKSFSLKYSLTTQELNFLKKDLAKAGATHAFLSGNVYMALTELGWELAKAEAKKQKEKEGTLINALMHSVALDPPQPAISEEVRNSLKDLFGKIDPSSKK